MTLDRKHKRIWRALIGPLSVLTLLITVGCLTLPAATQEREPICGLQEHIHTADCVDEDGQLVCGLQEHTHTEACYADRSDPEPLETAPTEPSGEPTDVTGEAPPEGADENLPQDGIPTQSQTPDDDPSSPPQTPDTTADTAAATRPNEPVRALNAAKDAVRAGGVQGIADSRLEDGKSYILYTASGTPRYALTASGGAAQATVSGQTVTCADESAVWTYQESTGSLVNANGQYLRIYSGGVTTSSSPQTLIISDRSGGTIRSGSYYLRQQSGRFTSTNNGYYATRMLFAAIPQPSERPFVYGKTVEKIQTVEGDIYRLTLSVSAPQDYQTAYSRVTMYDELSEYVRLDGEDLTVTVRRETGELVAEEAGALTLPATAVNPSVTLTAVYDAQSGAITLDFPPSYTLEDGWTYSLSAPIQPNNRAYAQYRTDRAYPHTGDEATGSLSAGQPGFYANRQGWLSCSYNGQPTATFAYPRPVVQVNADGCETYPGSQSHAQSLYLGKYVDKLPGDNDDYALTLTLTGPVERERTKVDLIFVLDTTASMSYAINGAQNNSYERWNAIEEAVDFTTGEIAGMNADPRYSMIWFNGNRSTAQNPYQDAGVACGWTDSRDGFLSVVTSYRSRLEGYTNYDAACYELVNKGTLLASARGDAKKVVVFISDGKPNVYYQANGATSGYSANSELTITNAVGRLNAMTGVDAFFTIGVGVSGDFVRLQRLTQNLPDGVVTGHYVCTDQQAVHDAFANMIDVVFKPKYSEVTMCDTLSEYAQLTEGSVYTLQVRDARGQTVGEVSGIYGQDDEISLTLPETEINPVSTLTLRYDDGQKRFTLDFEDTYILEGDWSYRLNAVIEPTPLAYGVYGEEGYPHDGDKGTGLSSTGQGGFFANTGATVDYRLNDGPPETAWYPKPVIQVLCVSGGFVLPDTGGAGEHGFWLTGAIWMAAAAAIEALINRTKGGAIQHRRFDPADKHSSTIRKGR
ncbi:MAG: vWA domain-containing protein [Acutalibacteraceae bacterium]|jgi:hypothetical protein